ncbi:MAG: FAD-binding oxidoreductase [Thaumarchaeota archaeon]|nr:FAD-binding oxidoreductase [Nitrososphaerota archaeon]
MSSNQVDVDSATLTRYSYDASECPAAKPDLVVLPVTVQDVVSVVRLANRFRVPITPVVSGTNGWGLHIPLRRGIVMDLSRMKKVVEINEEMRYMVVEPGTTVQTVQGVLAQRGLYTSIPKSCPAQASMLANLLIQGMGASPLRFGPQSDMINGLEAVLGGGEVVRCGSCGCSPYWFARTPLPELVGLFSGWYGSTGIVTKISFPIYKKPAYIEVVCLGIERPFGKDLGSLISSLVDLDVAEDISCYTPGVKFVGDDVKRSNSEIGLYLYATVSGVSQILIKAKRRALVDLADKSSVGGRPVRIMSLSKEDRSKYLKLPSLIDFDVERFGGSTNPCCHIPFSKWATTMTQVQRACHSLGRKPEFRLEAFSGSHYGSMMTYLRFNKDDKKDVETIRRLVRRVVEIYVDNGGLVWKAPPWAWKIQMNKSSAGFTKLLTKVKKTLDPNGIMSPSRIIG